MILESCNYITRLFVCLSVCLSLSSLTLSLSLSSLTLSLSLSLFQFQLLHHLLNVFTMASTEYNINKRSLLVITLLIKALVVTYKCVIMEHTTVSVLMIPLLLLMIQLEKLFVLNWDTQMVSILYRIINVNYN